ncbi:hypothetical protein MMC18_004593 [Xylographa bjoerkii]|nr:hypothetical protein [Xylographa bjoerkii]
MATRPYVEIDLSEETRLAQLRRIEELKGRIGVMLSQKSRNHGKYEYQAYHQTGYPYSHPNLASVGTASPSVNSEEYQVMGQTLSSAQLPVQEMSVAESDVAMDPWYGSDEMQFSDEDIDTESHSQSGHDHKMDTSDEASQSQRISSTPSKASGLSSNTSADPPEIKLEIDENAILHANNDNNSPVSSLSSQLSPVKSLTPAVLQPSVDLVKPKRRRRSTKMNKVLFSELRPRTSIPPNIPHEELARQSVEAALSSRLNPFALHHEEFKLLHNHICELHISAYINIRNRILRLWVRNPLVSVTPEEAAGCAYSSRWLGLAEVAYEWLLRRGYINFGCVEVPDMSNVDGKRYKLKRARKTIVVVGAGMAGLGCARQLEGLFEHYRERWTSAGEEPPRVIILEGRARIGGRIYSHPLRNQDSRRIPKHSRCVAEMGAHIITGFDHGNPLNMIIRGQLALHYYPLKDNSSLYDIDGKVVDRQRDKLVERLFNDILDRASVYRHHTTMPVTAEGNRDLIEAGRDPSGEPGPIIGTTDKNIGSAAQRPWKKNDASIEQVPGGLDKLTGKAHLVAGSRTKAPAAIAAAAMGWRLTPNQLAHHCDLDLDKVVRSSQYPTLGAAMDEGVRQYQALLALSAQDMRLLNWHFANLEYANAANVGKLSLGGWDQDIGNEFEGEHAQVIGGYQQVPRGILEYPSPLDLRTRKAVTRVAYDPKQGVDTIAEVICEDGDVIEAHHVVLTTPLGVLKDRSIKFKPELPSWKLDSIDRLGFGTLNKVILVYDKPFWDVDQDMIGLLRDASVESSLDQKDYTQNRGRFYLFWNCIKTSGRPVLIGLMAGDAAHQAEGLSDNQIVSEVTQQLATMFKQMTIPKPTETIVTRWGKDRFARGTYSYVGVRAQSGDYDAMAKPVGNLHFAGEATCGTHPATVHGAYISGLRAASEVIDDLLGPIVIPTPLVPTAIINKTEKASNNPHKSIPSAPLAPSTPLTIGETPEIKQARLEAFEAEILKAIFAKLGPRPDRPGRSGANPFLLFSKDQWADCKAKCDEARRAALGTPLAKASRNEIRSALGQMWREASAAMKQPYLEQTVSNRAVNHDSAATFQDRLAEWDAEAMSTRREYVQEHPGLLSREEEREMWKALGVYGGVDRRAKKMSGYADNSGSEMDI